MESQVFRSILSGSRETLVLLWVACNVNAFLVVGGIEGSVHSSLLGHPKRVLEWDAIRTRYEVNLSVHKAHIFPSCLCSVGAMDKTFIAINNNSPVSHPYK